MLIWLHPPAFRERFGEEMLCIFDETAAGGSAQLFADAIISLLRQWLVRSGIWKLAVGTALSGLVFACWASGFVSSQRTYFDQYNATHRRNAKAASPLDRAAFSRSAAEAVAILARFRKDHERRRHAAHLSSPHAARGPSTGSHSSPS